MRIPTHAAAAAVAAALCLLARTASGSGWDAIERIGGRAPVSVLVHDKPRVYFRVTPAAALEVPVHGPTRVRVVTRVECAGEGVATYRMRAAEGKNVFADLDTESSPAEGVRLAAGATKLGKSRRMTFDVPAGGHVITFTLAGAPGALVRLQTESKKSQTPMVSITPVVAERGVNVAEGERLIPYYTVLPERPVRLRVVGPTTLELSSRLDFDATMRGVQSYRLRLAEGGKTLRDVDLKTTKALGATYTNVADRIPSKLDVTRLAVPAGVHEITVSLVAPAGRAVQIRARIPEPSVGNEE